uniref:Uncharacterized protein n=1 Tax=Anguilla anguilla TaxID=7936 RepID=A0A0E9WFK3_ANGAN
MYRKTVIQSKHKGRSLSLQIKTVSLFLFHSATGMTKWGFRVKNK